MRLAHSSGIVAVSKRNFNRVRFGTHTIEQVLRNEGYVLTGLGVASEEGHIPLHRIKLIRRDATD